MAVVLMLGWQLTQLARLTAATVGGPSPWTRLANGARVGGPTHGVAGAHAAAGPAARLGDVGPGSANYDAMRDEVMRSRVVFEGGPAVAAAARLAAVPLGQRGPHNSGASLPHPHASKPHGAASDADAHSGDTGTAGTRLDPSSLAGSGNNGTQPDQVRRCRNTRQGRRMLTDDEGRQCQRGTVHAEAPTSGGHREAHPPQLLQSGRAGARTQPRPGCCPPPEVTGIAAFSCAGCDRKFNCCTTFETCVSCCLAPSNRALISALTQAGSKRHVVYASVTDTWQLCLFKCRTSSGSVVHENTYRSDAHFCFGTACPPLSVEAFEHYITTSHGDVRVDERPHSSPSLDAALKREYVVDPYLPRDLDSSATGLRPPAGAAPATHAHAAQVLTTAPAAHADDTGHASP